MKTDLITSILAAVVGTVAAFFICNLIVPKIEDFTYKTLDSNLQYTLKDPNVEVFNYRAVNPTVEIVINRDGCTGSDCETTVIIDNETKEPETEESPETEEKPETTPEQSEEEQSGTNEGPENGTTD